MARIHTNRPEVIAAVRALAQSWDFRGRGRYKSFGEDCRDLIAEGIYDRALLAQRLPGGGPLPRLAARTLARKRRLGYPETILVETKAMMDIRELRGQAAIERRTLSMVYGTTEETRLKMQYNTEGGDHRPPRPSYELDPAIEHGLDQLFEFILDRNIRDLGGR